VLVWEFKIIEVTQARSWEYLEEQDAFNHKERGYHGYVSNRRGEKGQSTACQLLSLTYVQLSEETRLDPSTDLRLPGGDKHKDTGLLLRIVGWSSKLPTRMGRVDPTAGYMLYHHHAVSDSVTARRTSFADGASFTVSKAEAAYSVMLPEAVLCWFEVTLDPSTSSQPS
jgi:hypothetical protein